MTAPIDDEVAPISDQVTSAAPVPAAGKRSVGVYLMAVGLVIMLG